MLWEPNEVLSDAPAGPAQHPELRRVTELTPFSVSRWVRTAPVGGQWKSPTDLWDHVDVKHRMNLKKKNLSHPENNFVFMLPVCILIKRQK